MTVVALVLLALLLPVTLHDLVRRPTIRRMGFRNVSRRRGEATLVVAGSMLATALIAASFIIGDSFGASVRDLAQHRWGPVDEIVTVDDPTQQQPLADGIAAANSSDIDGVLPATFTTVAIGSTGIDRSVEPSVRLLEMDGETARTFGGDVEATGLESVDRFEPGGIVLNDPTAATLGVQSGDRVTVHVGDDSIELTVTDIVDDTGLAGIGQAMVAPGSVLANLPDAAAVTESVVLVSNTGDVFDGADRTEAVIEQLDALVEVHAPAGTDIEGIKAALLDDAEEEAVETTSLFGTIGGFSVAAGILLVINLFVMLAGERRTELGTMRAVGVGRGAVVRSFALEGAVYGILAAGAGMVLGIGVAAGVVAFASAFFGSSDFAIRLAVEPTSLLSGAVIGFAISQLTVVATSFRTSRVNIVRAIRDLPEAQRHGNGRRALVASIVGLVIGVGGFIAAGSTPIVAMVAPVVALIAAIPLVHRVVPFVSTRTAIVVLCAAALAWSAAVFGVLPDTMDDPDVSLFLVQGILMVGLAVAIVAVLDGVWIRLARTITNGGIGTTIGLAHPLAKPLRSALLVSMYALVIFTVTFMAIMTSVFNASAPQLAEQASGAYDLVVDTNPTSTFTTAELQARPGVESVTPIVRGPVGLVRGDGDIDVWRGSFVPAEFSDTVPPELFTRADAFVSDDAGWSAVASGERNADGALWIVVPEDSGLEAGESLAIESMNGEAIEAAVAGVIRQDWLVGSGVHLSSEAAPALLGAVPPAARHYLTVSDDTTAEAVATVLDAEAPERGTDAEPFLALAEEATAENQGFLSMLQGYLGLGLLIGIAGLGVVLIRAVRERRRELAMLRAVGVSASVVRRSFLVEAFFIGLQGVVLGVGLGVLSGWQTLTRSTAFEEDLSFSVPVPWLVGLAVLCLGASLLAAVAPSARAGRIPPAAALRVTG